ncbi:DUF3429 domain-containing protein [uncultured Roseibium sp.]|uniref:DUF3429 domain-containing protein n=1 Tax=uncultured Roseibium sp. TaxID=1936171 RepID=UPI00260685A3|nr:DUF3429 domain-containing protein [uncultured Roseibium sp.]
MSPSPTQAAVPLPAKWLGGTGALPFVAAALIAVFGPQVWSAWAAYALAVYGAVILSFLGGIQWGLTMGREGRPNLSATRLGLSVVPSLIGWVALLMPVFPGLLVLSAAFALVLYLDLQASMRGEAPAWYPKLRIPLSIAVMGSLLLGSLGTI